MKYIVVEPRNFEVVGVCSTEAAADKLAHRLLMMENGGSITSLACIFSERVRADYSGVTANKRYERKGKIFSATTFHRDVN